MKILLTNIWLENHAGTEVGIREMALAYSRRGHSVQVYSPILGNVAKEIRSAGIFITDDINELKEEPDIIHGQQYVSSMNALLRFKTTPAIYFCRDSTFKGDAPPKLSNIIRYAAVDEKCLKKLVVDYGIEESKTQVILNWVDLKRFTLKESVADVPKKALVFSNYATTDNFYLAIEEACKAAGISLEVLGNGFGNNRPDPESVLGNYDIVFAKGKAAIEAMACGAAVIICDFLGVGGMITSENYSKLRRLNFSYGNIEALNEAPLLLEEIKKYNRADVMAVSKLIRAEADFDLYIDHLLRYYEEIIEEYKSQPTKDNQAKDAIITETYDLQQYFLNLQVKRYTNEIHRLLGNINRNEHQSNLTSLQEGMSSSAKIGKVQHSIDDCHDVGESNLRENLKFELEQIKSKYAQIQQEKEAFKNVMGNQASLKIHNHIVQKELEKQVLDLKSSLSFRLGWFLTAPARKMWDLFFKKS